MKGVLYTGQACGRLVSAGRAGRVERSGRTEWLARQTTALGVHTGFDGIRHVKPY